MLMLGAAPAVAPAATSFGPLSGAAGCLVAPGSKSADNGTADCGDGKGLLGASAVAISPDGQNIYVASGTAGTTQASSFGSLEILRRNSATGAISEVGCLSSDGTDGRDGASGACVQTPSLLGADGVTVSPDGSAVFVTTNISASVVAFARDPATGSLSGLGCFQYRPPHGSKCPPANVFPGSGAVLTSADGKALYMASPTEGSISTLIAGEVTSPSATAGSGVTVASIFGLLGTTEFLGNPCVAVNGFDGSCGVGVATRGLDALALSPDGAELYAAAPGSEAVDVFTHDASGTLTESSCLKVSAPPGLCRSSRLMNSPTQLSISPDGRNVYVADGSENEGRVDVLARDPSTGALSDASCVEGSPAPKNHEESEEEENKEENNEPTPAGGDCDAVPGLESVDAIAVTGNGSEVYAIGDQSAVVFSRDPSSGKLTEVSCAASEDSRCTSFPSLQGVEGAAVSPDGRFLYIAAAKIDAVLAFGVGSNVTTASASASRAGIARVGVQCPRALRRPCSGQLELTRAVRARGAHRRRLQRIVAGGSRRFAIRPGARTTISVHLSPTSRRLLFAHRRLRLMAIVRADPLAGGSGYGRALRLSLGPH